jgi:hypothetical protein
MWIKYDSYGISNRVILQVHDIYCKSTMIRTLKAKKKLQNEILNKPGMICIGKNFLFLIDFVAGSPSKSEYFLLIE